MFINRLMITSSKQEIFMSRDEVWLPSIFWLMKSDIYSKYEVGLL